MNPALSFSAPQNFSKPYPVKSTQQGAQKKLHFKLREFSLPTELRCKQCIQRIYVYHRRALYAKNRCFDSLENMTECIWLHCWPGPIKACWAEPGYESSAPAWLGMAAWARKPSSGRVWNSSFSKCTVVYISDYHLYSLSNEYSLGASLQKSLAGLQLLFYPIDDYDDVMNWVQFEWLMSILIVR